MIWSIDPGETIGFCTWENSGLKRLQKKVTVDELMSMLDVYLDVLDQADESVDKIIVEQWALSPGKTQGGNKMVSSQVIGMMRLFAYLIGAEVIFQDPRILKVSALHTGTPIPKNGHFDDDISAYLHGHYYFVVNGILKPPNQVH